MLLKVKPYLILIVNNELTEIVEKLIRRNKNVQKLKMPNLTQLKK